MPEICITLIAPFMRRLKHIIDMEYLIVLGVIRPKIPGLSVGSDGTQVRADLLQARHLPPRSTSSVYGVDSGTCQSETIGLIAYTWRLTLLLRTA
jgi:hypothetical protein